MPMQGLQNLDRRWIFLLMAIAVAVPILFGLQFPESPSQLARDVFNEIEQLEEGDNVLMAWDYDPSTEGELGPMAIAFARHCCEKKVNMFFITLLPVGPQMIEKAITEVIQADFPDLVYGQDYVNLGYKSGYEGVIKVIVTDLKGLYTTDARGTNIDQIPMCKPISSVQEMDLIVNVSGSYPGTKEWVQYAVTPHQGEIRMVAGCTGVQAPLLYPYIPGQLKGLLGAIKGAAEYEALVVSEYLGNDPDQLYLEAKRRMGPQLVAHLLMIGLIIAGNVIYFRQRRMPSPQQN
ncbi:hypothetical protein KOR42_35060 [Thalassoglobus neptunius]|uniref:Uncharacterized protein n=1 Tax=Thalassoglobus neptunius TaxID=1938619 RepID=A0A5C5WLS8_9PLAN|nr:hypothetical protein [Thalassoglobus neptunius]TWT51618.1 hypothetical protein KOR42_35060 [Thalassoglobus neptunius]